MTEPKPTKTGAAKPAPLKVNGIIYEPYAQMHDARAEGTDNWRQRMIAPTTEIAETKEGER